MIFANKVYNLSKSFIEQSFWSCKEMHNDKIIGSCWPYLKVYALHRSTIAYTQHPHFFGWDFTWQCLKVYTLHRSTIAYTQHPHLVEISPKVLPLNKPVESKQHFLSKCFGVEWILQSNNLIYYYKLFLLY